MTPAEIEIYETHAAKGSEILSKVPGVPNDLIQIVLHHHERNQGTGFPNKLRKTKIHPLARVIAVADEFCDIVIKNSNSAGMSPKDAVVRLLTLQKYGLDAELIQALGEVLKGK